MNYLPRKKIIVPVSPDVLQWLRALSKLSVNEVSKRSKIRKNAYMQMESGKKKPTLQQVRLLARIFRRPIAAFLLPFPLKPKSFEVVDVTNVFGEDLNKIIDEKKKEGWELYEVRPKGDHASLIFHNPNKRYRGA